MKVRPKKSLGQNFLKSKKAIEKIVAAADLNGDDVVLEIGPGTGVLTEALLKKVRRVIAIEKDNSLAALLKEKFLPEIKNKKLEIITSDILENTENLIPKESYKLVANIPYYITGAIIRLFLETKNQPSRMVLMLQKEVARRIIANDKKESLLSLSVKAYGEPKYIDTVEAIHFTPKPKVDSAILLVKNISRSFFTNISEKDFFRIIKAGFSHKRKILARNLESEFEKEKIKQAFSECGINEKVRAEDLNLENWKTLAADLQKRSEN